jgi:hypothetical protein
VIGAPELHHWHHDHDRDAGNYANLSPLMDLLFGTYTCPGHEPRAFGIAEPMWRSYLGQMIYPFLPRRKKGELKCDGLPSLSKTSDIGRNRSAALELAHSQSVVKSEGKPSHSKAHLTTETACR